MPLRFFFPICAFYKKIKRKESKKNQFFTKNLKKYLYKKEYYKGKKVYIRSMGKRRSRNERSTTGDKSRWMPWITPTGKFNNNNSIHQVSFMSSGCCVSGKCVATCVGDVSVFCFLELQQGLKSRGSIITSPNRPL